MERDDRIGRAGLDAEVAVRPREVEHLPGQRAERREGARTAGAQAEPVGAVLLEDGRPDPERDRQVGRREPASLARVGRWQRWGLALGTEQLTLGEHGGGVAPRAQQVAQLRGRGQREVERRERQPVLRRCRDTRLVRAVERHGAGHRVVGLARAERVAGSAAEKQADCAPARYLEQPPAGDVQSMTFAATVESGSASASTAWASDFRSFAVSSPYSAQPSGVVRL